MDASAGLGIIHRRGAGRIRHIHTPALWLQRAHQDGLLVAQKVDGAENVADLGTKHVDRPTFVKMLTKCGMVALPGRSRMAFRAALASEPKISTAELDANEVEAVDPLHYQCQSSSQANEQNYTDLFMIGVLELQRRASRHAGRAGPPE